MKLLERYRSSKKSKNNVGDKNKYVSFNIICWNRSIYNSFVSNYKILVKYTGLEYCICTSIYEYKVLHYKFLKNTCIFNKKNL